MAEETFAGLGKAGAIKKLYEDTPFKPFESTWFETGGKCCTTVRSGVFLEGTDFDLVYFPLKHLGYKCVTAVTGELYAEFSHPKVLSAVIGVSSKLDYKQIEELWGGITAAAREHGYGKVGLDLVPSMNGLVISLSAAGETSLLACKRRAPAKSMDLICISDNLGAAFLGFSILQREKKRFEKKEAGQKQPELEKYKNLIGEYLKPVIDPKVTGLMEEAGIIPSYGYLVDKGLSEAVGRLVRDSGLGAKIYVEKIPFAGGTFDVAKELNIDPVSAAMNGGEDYRLMFTIPIGKHDKFRHDFQTFDIIGHLARPETGAVVVTPDGVEFPVKQL